MNFTAIDQRAEGKKKQVESKITISTSFKLIILSLVLMQLCNSEITLFKL